MGRLWRKFVVAEDPREKERVRQKRIDNIMHDVVLLESHAALAVRTQGPRRAKDSPFSKEQG